MSDSFMNIRTGEVVEDVARIVTNSQESNITAYKIKLKKARKLNKLIAQHCGGFFFYRYDNLLETIGGKTDVAFRFIYLCASATPEGYFIKYNNEKCVTKKDFTYIFDKPLRSTQRYVDELIDVKLLYKDEEGYRLNPIFYYCNLDDETAKRKSVRTFRNCIRELYVNSDPNEHSYMGEILKFVPYINLYNNILCWYPEEPDKNKIQPLTLQEIRFILRANSNYGYEIERKLESLFIKGEPVFGKFEAAEEYQYIINPRLLYRGNDPLQFKGLIDQFDVAKGQYLNKIEKKKTRKKMNQ